MESKKRLQLMFNVQNDTIINNIIGGLKPMMNKIISMFENVLEYIGYSLIGYKKDINLNYRLIIKQKQEIKELNQALELSVAMSKNDYDNLKDSFNKYVLRPKAEKMLVNLGYGVKAKKMLDDYDKECEDYSYEYELEGEALAKALVDDEESK